MKSDAVGGLDVVVLESALRLQLLAGEDQALLPRGLYLHEGGFGGREAPQKRRARG